MRLTPYDLRCEHVTDPLGVEAERPRLSWALRGEGRGLRQAAWEVRAASTAERLRSGDADRWSSGRVEGAAQLIAWGSSALRSAAEVHWQVRAWETTGAGPWSAPARFDTGLAAGDWRGAWIARLAEAGEAPAPLLRRTFTVRAGLRSARLYLSGLGYADTRINGTRVDERLLDPGVTRYDRAFPYVVHDVGALLRTGENAIGVALGSGWLDVHTRAVWEFHAAPWRMSPRLRGELRLRYDDGTEVIVASGADWRCATGGTRFDSIYAGETHDARLEPAGWDAPGFDDSGWSPALLVPAPAGAPRAQIMPPVRAQRRLAPRSITQTAPGVHLVDFGQDIAGHVRIHAAAPAGTAVEMRYAERLDAAGRIETADIDQHVVKHDTARRFQTDRYVFGGTGRESWEARFTWHGFRFVEVHGWPGAPSLDELTAIEHSSAQEPCGSFASSIPLLDRIRACTDWSYRANWQAVPTDCPHREKNGWTGDAHLACDQGLFTYRGAAHYEKWLDDLRDEQRDTGELPGIVPTGGWGYAWGNGPAWDSAYHEVCRLLHEHLGDTRMYERHYDRLKRYVDYLGTRAVDLIVPIGLGDWCPARTETPVEVTSTAFWHRDARTVAHAARLLGRTQDAEAYEALATRIAAAFSARFLDRASGRVANGSQTAQACALHFELLPAGDRPRVFAELLRLVEGTGGHLDCGILGTSWLLRVLHAHGRDDVALRIATQEDFPSWGHWLAQGATTLWENWNGRESRDHIMFGDILAWMFRALGGIDPDPAHPGFARVTVSPPAIDGIERASARHDSIRGPWIVAWQREGTAMTLELTVPPNAEALVRLPAADAARVREGDGLVTDADGVRVLGRAADGRVELLVGSGRYRFASG